MNYQPQHTLGLVLARTNYGESDRIVTFLTKDCGKVRVIAKGVRKERAKLAVGVELFSISEIGFIVGKSDLATLVGARLKKSYHHFLDDLNRVNFGFDSLKKLNKVTADATDGHYFDIVQQLLIALDDKNIDLSIINLWWNVNLAQLTGHGLNLTKSADNKVLKESKSYAFNPLKGSFVEDEEGLYKADHIKLLRLILNCSPKALMRVKGATTLAKDLTNEIAKFSDYHYQIGA